MRIVECVPNFSEGRDKSVIGAIAGAIKAVDGVKLLNVDPGADFNRTVYTFVGEPEPVLEAAFQAAKVGIALIDMRKHKGEHARMGALDVMPFIPIKGVSMDDCVKLSKRFGERMAREL
ncbi:MAG: glutamate formimidoyltransferase, partial [Euryarchaeota archaeon CG01_land_8_20_14_3_00_38_12]